MKIADVNLLDTFGNPYKDTVEGVSDVDFKNDFVVIHVRVPDGAVGTLAAYRSDRVLSVHTYYVEREQG